MPNPKGRSQPDIAILFESLSESEGDEDMCGKCGSAPCRRQPGVCILVKYCEKTMSDDKEGPRVSGDETLHEEAAVDDDNDPRDCSDR